MPPLERTGRRARRRSAKKTTAKKRKSRKKRARAPASHMFVTVYDNINMMVRVAEQILGRKNAQENGTCATIIPLHDAKPEHLLTSTLDTSVLSAPPLRIEDLLLNEAELDFHTKNMKWQKDLDAMQPVSPNIITVHKTPIHPLPSMEIDENSITGNIEYLKYIKIIAGDQLTIARQRSILTCSHAWRNIVLMPGLFHAKIADSHGMLETHFGKANAGTRSPGSLGFHNTVLDRLPITLTSLPPFRTCRDLIMVSLYARVLHCLLLVAGKDSLDDYTSSVNSWAVIVGHAQALYSRFADPDVVQELREQRIPDERKRDADAAAAKKGASKGTKADDPLPHVKKGDMVLKTRFYSSATRGDSGRVVNILRLWVFSYRGSGRSKYAHEMLHLLHNLISVWTKELRHVILQNWLLNPTGKPNSFVEIDLVQEHLNFWIKVLATRINTDLGARQGAKHTIPQLAEDIAVLMDSLDEHDVYTLQPGRVLDDDEKPTLRERRRLTPIADLLLLLDEEVDADDEEILLASPTLTCFNAGDVALDMDVHDWFSDGEEDDSEYEGSSDELDGDE
ncbi:hypothetical protein B0H10DRAFT_2082155 [Mycena sp. CBHHK59/15]|nr:hypothetical protein B0H10DRAFT_2082155 [Mycena sp. CBHHK59/15]